MPRRDFSLPGLYSQRCPVCRPFPEVRRFISRNQVKMRRLGYFGISFDSRGTNAAEGLRVVTVRGRCGAALFIAREGAANVSQPRRHPMQHQRAQHHGAYHGGSGDELTP
jgi:hypothetical protein